MPAKIQSLFPHLRLLDHPLPPLLTPRNPALFQPDPPIELSDLSSPLLLAFLVALGLYLSCASSASRFDETLNEDKHSEALTALTAIFTPTKSSWPSDILDATRRASVSRSGRGFGDSPGSFRPGRGEIRLRFSALYDHILNGNLELQPTASVNLVKAMLSGEGTEVDGWKVKLVVEWKWAWKVSLWIVKSLGSRLVDVSQHWSSDVQKASHLLERAKVPFPHLIYALDSLPTFQHERFARQLYHMLQSDSPLRPSHVTEEDSGRHAIVTFSTISAPSTPLSTVTLCGLPFSLRVPLGEPTPILLSLRRAVKSLSSAGGGARASEEAGRLVVMSVEDTSGTYADALVEAVKQMECDADFRGRLADELGVKGWRREMFSAELEAGLYGAGLMKRWEVLVGVS